MALFSTAPGQGKQVLNYTYTRRIVVGLDLEAQTAMDTGIVFPPRQRAVKLPSSQRPVLIADALWGPMPSRVLNSLPHPDWSRTRASARQRMTQLGVLRKRLFQITTDQVDELRQEAVRLPGNTSDVRLQDPDRTALLQKAVDQQRHRYDDPKQLIRHLIRRRIWYSACFGGIFALPGIIPGIGTVAQFVFGFATTVPETDLVRNQMWCLYVELSHVYGRSIGARDLDFLREEWQIFSQVNKGEEAGKQIVIRQMRRWLSHPRLHNNLQQMLLRLGLPEATIRSMGKSVTRGVPFALGVAIGAMINAHRVHRFAQSMLRQWNEVELSHSLAIWEEQVQDSQECGALVHKSTHHLDPVEEETQDSQEPGAALTTES